MRPVQVEDTEQILCRESNGIHFLLMLTDTHWSHLIEMLAGLASLMNNRSELSCAYQDSEPKSTEYGAT